MVEELLNLVSQLSIRLCVMHEISYLPEDVEYIDPIGTMSLIEAKLVLSNSDFPIPEELESWLYKVHGARPN